MVYLHSGDWVENLTALEYHQGAWSLYRYEQDVVAKSILVEETAVQEMLDFESMMREFLPTNAKAKSGHRPATDPAEKNISLKETVEIGTARGSRT